MQSIYEFLNCSCSTFYPILLRVITREILKNSLKRGRSNFNRENLLPNIRVDYRYPAPECFNNE